PPEGCFYTAPKSPLDTNGQISPLIRPLRRFLLLAQQKNRKNTIGYLSPLLPEQSYQWMRINEPARRAGATPARRAREGRPLSVSGNPPTWATESVYFEAFSHTWRSSSV